MPYISDVRSNAANSVISVGGKLFIEGQEVTPTNLAPVAFSRGPSINIGGSATTGSGDGQLIMQWVYRRGGLGVGPGSGTRGNFNSARISCGQAVFTDFVKSATLGTYYGNYSANTVATYNGNFRAITYGSPTVGSTTPLNTSTQTGLVFLPSQSDGWLTVTQVSTLLADTTGNVSGNYSSISKLSEAGVVSNASASLLRLTSLPYIGTDYVVIVGTPFTITATINDASYAVQASAVNRSTGAAAVLISGGTWIPVALTAAGGAYHRGCFPSNYVTEVPGSSIYFYHPIITNTTLTIYVGTVSGLSGGSPTITAASGNVLTAVGGGALNTSQVSFPATVPSNTSFRQVRAWVFENAGVKYLCVNVYEPGTGSTVATTATELYLWRLDSKTTATFLQKVGLSTTGRVRAILPTDTNQNKIVVVYDTSIAFYSWNVSTNWTFLSSQAVQHQEVGVDVQGRVWVTTSTGDYSTVTPQSLYLFEGAGAAANITLSFAANSYTYAGVPLASTLVVNAYDVLGNRVALNVTLARDTENFEFAGGASTISVLTSASADTSVPVSIINTGRLTCLAAPT